MGTNITQPALFTEKEIRGAYAKTRTGADFPRLIKDLKAMGIVSYDHMLETGSNIFYSKDGQAVSLSHMGPSAPVDLHPNWELLKKYISMHQSGLTNYPTLCGQAGEAGVEKWTSDLLAMTCTYFDKSGNKMHVELIPDGEYKKMDTQVMEETTQRSLRGTITFGEVVMKLLSIGAESYTADLVRMEKTNYMPDGQTYLEKLDYKGPAIAQDFSQENVVAAIKAIQKKEITYAEFLNRILKAGCTHYMVFLQGKKAIYFGRKGDFHIEHFPK